MADREKIILDDVSAVFPAGEVSAILGPSGAGKVRQNLSSPGQSSVGD